jgi:hypothetical protein
MAEIVFGVDAQVDDGFGSGSGTAYADLVNVLDVTPPAPEQGVVTFLPLNAASNVKQKLPGVIDGKEWKVKQVYTETEYLRLYGLKGVLHNWKIKVNSTDTIIFAGFVFHVELDQMSDPEALKTFTSTIAVTTELTIA